MVRASHGWYVDTYHKVDSTIMAKKKNRTKHAMSFYIFYCTDELENKNTRRNIFPFGKQKSD